jgi:hypothetical protein
LQHWWDLHLIRSRTPFDQDGSSVDLQADWVAFGAALDGKWEKHGEEK